MHEILEKKVLAPKVNYFRIRAERIAKKRQAGQFVIIRVSDQGERIPLTIADADPEEGSITLVVQEVGKTTEQMGLLQTGDSLLDVVGPLGRPTHIEKKGTVLIVGGGIGIAPAHPIAQAHRKIGNHVIGILGARNKEMMIMEEEMHRACHEVIVMTDDGSYGEKGMVTDAIKKLVESGVTIDECIAIGPPVMMKYVSLTTKPYKIPTLVSLNTIMIDGTGMCGGCRVRVGGKNRFVCVDGPEFDGHQVDFDNMMLRLNSYKEQEKQSLDHWHEIGGPGCNFESSLKALDAEKEAGKEGE